MNKSLLTNLVALICIIASYAIPGRTGEHLSSIGYFAFSGAITNWLAVHMLFEKIPGLYGSGVIPNRFEEFKSGIKHLMMNQFFNTENLERIFKEMKFSDNNAYENSENLDGFRGIIASIDYEKVYRGLTDVVLTSPMGGMLAMMGGHEALAPLRSPFEEKMKEILFEIGNSDEFQEKLSQSFGQNGNDVILTKIEGIVDTRLEELTPKMVKEIIQEMIHKHLGWLVVWGGVFGGVIGLIMSFANS
ncbi:MAG: DUF445 domain-containing protein [Bdellovibrionota bacterium]